MGQNGTIFLSPVFFFFLLEELPWSVVELYKAATKRARFIWFVATALLFGACGLTMTWFPGRFWHLVHVSPVTWFALSRNVLLVLVFAAVAVPLMRSMRRPVSELFTQLRGAVLRPTS